MPLVRLSLGFRYLVRLSYLTRDLFFRLYSRDNLISVNDLLAAFSLKTKVTVAFIVVQNQTLGHHNQN